MDAPTDRTVSVGGRKRVSLKRIAESQRWLVRLFALMLLLYIAMIVAGAIGISSSIMLVSLAVVQLGVLIGIMVQTIRLMIAMGRHPVVAAVMGLLMIVPLLGLLILLSTNSRATAMLQNNGVRVGFMGVSDDELGKLVIGACEKCGYDIRSIQTGRCPECGYSVASSLS